MAGAGVDAGLLAAAFALFAGLLAGVSPPQAMPRAPRPRTVESTSTFFIFLLRLLFFFSKYFPVSGIQADLTRPFCPELFLSLSKRKDRDWRDNCQQKKRLNSKKNYHYFSGLFYEKILTRDALSIYCKEYG